MTIEEIIAGAKQDLEIAMKTMPDGVAELSDYELWGKDFVAKLVSNPATSHNRHRLKRTSGLVRGARR